MKIAIITEEYFPIVEELQKRVNEKQNIKEWEINYFDNGKDFLSKDPYSYDAVLIDHSLRDGSESLILNVLLENEIDIAVMNGPSSVWSDLGLVQDTQVNALIDKTDPQNVLDWINYVDVKHRLTSKLKQESGIYAEIISNTNGCFFEIKDEVTVLGISRLLTKDRIDVITKSIESTNNKAVLYFTDEIKTISSSYFGLIVTFWERIVKERKGKMAFWMRNEDDTVVRLANLFCINELFPCFSKLDEAINFVKRAESNEKRKHRNGNLKRSYA